MDDNRALLKPEQGIAYVRLKGVAAQQAQQAAQFLGSEYASPNDLLIGMNGLLADLVYDPNPALVEPFEHAISRLGLHLGFATQRPERDYKKGPDVFWHFGGNEYAVIEAKNNVVTDFIRKHDLGQLAVSVNWFNNEYEQPASAIPVMFHRFHKPNKDAFAPPGTRIVTDGGLKRLKSALSAFATALASEGQSHNPDRVGEQLMHHKINGKNALLTFATSTVAHSG